MPFIMPRTSRLLAQPFPQHKTTSHSAAPPVIDDFAAVMPLTLTIASPRSSAIPRQAGISPATLIMRSICLLFLASLNTIFRQFCRSSATDYLPDFDFTSGRRYAIGQAICANFKSASRVAQHTLPGTQAQLTACRNSAPLRAEEAAR